MSVAQWEREAISERTHEAMNELKRRGMRTGGAGYGWKWSKKPDATGCKQLILHPEEQARGRRDRQARQAEDRARQAYCDSVRA